MNAFLEPLASESWSHIIQALLHTLWIGGVATAGLFVVLRFAVRPEVRYRWCVAGMASVFLGGLIAWGVLQEKAAQAVAVSSEVSHGTYESHVTHRSYGREQNAPVVTLPTQARPTTSNAQWTPWLALVWLFGMTLMLMRSAVSVASAESIRTTGQPLEDPAILQLLEETRKRLGLARRVRVVLTETLSTPAVMGVLVPTLILPLSLVTSMPLQQLQFVFLHELAHVRRGDYLANLFQLLIESLLFFNPAIWWISRQMRHEREACCDAIAIELTGGRVAYAETLAQVAQSMLAAAPRGVPAFGERKSSSLMDRVQRILVPGYRPGMSLTWKALFASLFLGGLLFLISAVGTRITVSAAAKLLTPQERIERIEHEMVERGTNLQPEIDEKEQIEVRGTIRTEDGAPLPKNFHPYFAVIRDRSTSHDGARSKGNGVYTATLARGDVYFAAAHEDYAPAVVGPVNTRKLAEVPEMNLVLKRGFTVSFRVSDKHSGEPVPGAVLKCLFYFPNNLGSSLSQERQVTTDSQGKVKLDHCADYPLHVKLEKAGYEYTSIKFESLKENSALEIPAQKSQPTRGVVLQKATGKPIAGASIHVLSGEGLRHPFNHFNPWSPGIPLTKTDKEGLFTLASLPAAGRYSLVVDASGYTQELIHDVRVGQENLKALLPPEIFIKGRITGDLSKLRKSVSASVQYRTTGGPFSSYGVLLPVEIKNGVGHFTFTNKFGSAVTLEIAGQKFENPDNANGEWNIEISEKEPVKRREVVLRFAHPSGVPPTGTINVTVPDKHSDALMNKEVAIENGEVRVTARVGYFNYEPARTVGYWFKKDTAVEVPEGNGPFIIDVPVIPAGAIYAKARNADGTPATDVSFSVIETEKSPLISNQWAHVEMNKGVATPLPLGGTYRIRAGRNYSVCLSEPIALTEKQPDREVQLQFTPGVDIEGQLLSPEGKPIPNSIVSITWNYKNSGFGLMPIATDFSGRFRFDSANATSGDYRLTFRSPGMKSVFRQVDLSKLPIIVRMESGLKLSGKVVEKKSGHPIPNAPVRIYGGNGDTPIEQTMTDANGNFTFDTLHDTSYGIHVDGANYDGNQAREYKPGEKPIVLEMVLPHWSQLKVARQ